MTREGGWGGRGEGMEIGKERGRKGEERERRKRERKELGKGVWECR